MSTLVTGAVQSDTFKNKAGTREYGRCTAWVNFNGTGTVAIRGSLNVSSITDNGTGNYTVNFEQNMVNANYSATAGLYSIAYNQSLGFDTGTVNSIRMISGANSAISDNTVIHLQIFGGDA